MIRNAIEYARAKVYFWQDSPIHGAFCETKYPFCIKPLLRLDEIYVHSEVLLGPTQSFKTVILNIAIAYFLDIYRASVLAVSQTDDDAKDFARMKLNPFLERIESLMMTLRDKHTISQWLWAAHELIISGPGENAQESKSVRCLFSDESHRWGLNNPGAMAALANRMGQRWNRKEFHCTTAADAGVEVDLRYHDGDQNEWHQSCPKCHKLIWPKWEEDSRSYYNGHRVFQWIDSQSETETLESIHMVCPHCSHVILDRARNRLALDDGADYVTMNPGASNANASYRYNAFAPRWKQWREMLAIYLNAIHSAKLGDLTLYEDWIKKQEVRTNLHEYPMLGGSSQHRNFSMGDITVEPDTLRTVTFDLQEGKNNEGFHLWSLAEIWYKDGRSKRIEYVRLNTWDELRAFQFKHGVENVYRKGQPDIITTAGDSGARAREVFAMCERFKWLALKSGDEDSFAHIMMQPGQRTVPIHLPYSALQLQSVTGNQVPTQFKGRGVPEGFALGRAWSKPALYPMLYALKNGTAGREYGIPKDINPAFITQLHSYVPTIVVDKVTNSTRKVAWKKVSADDHGFVCAAQGLTLAILAGFYPVLIEEKKVA